MFACIPYHSYNFFFLDPEDDLFEVVNSVSSRAARFSSLGMALGIKQAALEKIKHEHRDKSDEALKGVIHMWLRQANLTKGAESASPSWKTLVAAVDAPAGGEDPALAKKIATAHPGR